MPQSNFLNTPTIGYLDPIGNVKSYRVPPYQRDCSLSGEQEEDSRPIRDAFASSLLQ